mgnify:FL=1
MEIDIKRVVFMREIILFVFLNCLAVVGLAGLLYYGAIYLAKKIKNLLQ